MPDFKGPGGRQLRQSLADPSAIGLCCFSCQGVESVSPPLESDGLLICFDKQNVLEVTLQVPALAPGDLAALLPSFWVLALRPPGGEAAPANQRTRADVEENQGRPANGRH